MQRQAKKHLRSPVTSAPPVITSRNSTPDAARNLCIANTYGLVSSLLMLTDKLKKSNRTPVWLLSELETITSRANDIIPPLLVGFGESHK